MKHFIFLGIFSFTILVQAQRSDFSTIDFQKADEIARRYKGEDLSNLPVLSLQLTAQLKTDVERFRVIYKWVCENIKGNYHLTTESSYKQRKLRNDSIALFRWHHSFKKEVFTKLLQEKETLCTGYTYLIKEMSNLAGLECEIINGFNEGYHLKKSGKEVPNHSWNAIKLNGKWYLCDATWSSGIIDMNGYDFIFQYDDSFFLMEPSNFAKSHTPIEEKWTLLEAN